MTTNRDIVRRFYEELWNQWSLGLADEIVAPEIRFRGSLGRRLVGRARFIEYVRTVRHAFPDWHNEIGELIDCGEHVIARITCAGTHRGQLGSIEPTGARVRYEAVAIFTIRTGQIHDGWVVGDTQELWRAFGRPPPGK